MKSLQYLVAAAAIACGSSCALHRDYQREVCGYELDMQLPGKTSIATHVADHTTVPVGYGIEKAGTFLKETGEEYGGPHWLWKGPVVGAGHVIYQLGNKFRWGTQSGANGFPIFGDSWSKLVFSRDSLYLDCAPRDQIVKKEWEIVVGIGPFMSPSEGKWLDPEDLREKKAKKQKRW